MTALKAISKISARNYIMLFYQLCIRALIRDYTVSEMSFKPCPLKARLGKLSAE